MHLNPLDTSAEAREIQNQAHARLGPWGRMKAAFELSEAVRAMRFAGLRSQRPGASESDLVRLFLAETHGIHALRALEDGPTDSSSARIPSKRPLVVARPRAG